MATTYVLTMNEEQARQTIAALDFWMRMRIGQWKELIDLCLPYEPGKADEYCEKREDAEKILMQARQVVMPDLHGDGHSFGVYNFSETERAFNVLKAVRSAIAYHHKPEGGWTVDFDKPLAVHVVEEMPKCEAVEK